MEEVIPQVGPEQNVELVLHRSHERRLVSFMTPQDATYLARGLLACSSALCGPNPPLPGTIIPDSHIPVRRWVVKQSANDELLLILSIPSGLDLTFSMPLHN
jgi:hypothetical protein